MSDEATQLPADPALVIGRIVHYVSYGSKDGRYESTCRAAVVTAVPDPQVYDDTVSLAVLNPTGVFFDRQVRHSQDNHSGGTWHWPAHRPEGRPADG